jgi:hypothetical protein
MPLTDTHFDQADFRYPRYRRRGWIGVDLDGTLALSGPTPDPLGIGEPVPLMLMRVQHWLSTGRTVKIFTIRANDPVEVRKIHTWCARHGLPALPVTNTKDSGMLSLWDDRAVGVVSNLGIPLLPAKLGFWQRLRIALRILFGRASGMRAAGAPVTENSPPAIRDHLRDVLDLAHSVGSPGHSGSVFAEIVL